MNLASFCALDQVVKVIAQFALNRLLQPLSQLRITQSGSLLRRQGSPHAKRWSESLESLEVAGFDGFHHELAEFIMG